MVKSVYKEQNKLNIMKQQTQEIKEKKTRWIIKRKDQYRE